ncbi:hypothetical protein PSCICJ_04180 [Pseudomonas cichorii]|nr:hypothetical protein PSCICJ_04180 [Pseudomonas cichorii]
MTAYLLNTQQFLPEFGNRRFELALRCFIDTAGQGRLIRCRQRLAIQLAVGGQWQRFQHHKGTWQHMLGQGLQQLVAQVSGRWRFTLFCNDISHQTLVARDIFASDNHRFTDTLTSCQLRFDLTQLDPETADLHLVVVTAQVIEATFGGPASQVASAVQTSIFNLAERIGDKPLFIQFRTVQITPRHAGTTHIQLTDHTDRHRLTVGIQHVSLQIRDSHTNRADTRVQGICCLQRTIGHVNRGLGNAIHVHQLRSGVHRTCIPRLENPGFQGFTTKDHLTQRVRLLTFTLGRNQLAEGAWRLVQHRHPSITQQGIAFLRRTADQLRHDQQLATVYQRAPDFPDREVEGKGVKQRPGIGRTKVEPGLSRGEQPCNVAMLDLHTLRQTGGARGVDHIGQV